MPNYRRDREGRTYFFTVVSHQRRPILCDDRIRAILRDAIRLSRKSRPFAIDAWVLLPDHLHCIWTLPESDCDYSARWGWPKKEATKAARLSGVIGHRTPSLWQNRFWEHRIRDERDLRLHCDYIHWNPVKHGLVSEARLWPWSTFHLYARKGLLPADWGNGGIILPDGVGRE